MLTTITLILITKWEPTNLNTELYAIAYNESSYGLNTNHVKSVKGRDWTAIGPLGIKPVTAFDAIRHSAKLKIRYGDYTIDQIADALESNSVFYNDACNAHWDYLRRTFSNNVTVMAYAWRWGVTAAKNATWLQVAFDQYVIKYMDHRRNLGNGK